MPTGRPAKLDRLAAVNRRVPDVIESGLTVLFCAINPRLNLEPHSRVHRMAASLALLCVVAVAGPVAGQSSSPRSLAADTTAIHKSERFIRDTMRTLGVPGAAVCVARGERIVWSEAFGLADVERQTPATVHTRFRIGSVSKSLTAAGLALLVQDGKLDLDTPIQRYVPSFPLKPWPITTRELAGHLAGVRHYASGEFESRRHYNSILDGLSLFAGDTLLFEPSTQFAYSSYGYNLISAVLEGASGEPFLTLMHSRVFEPAGMSETVADFPDRVMPLRAQPYVHPDSTPKVIPAPPVDNSYKWASGGFLSTATDLCRFGQTLLEGRLIHREMVRLLWTSQRTRDDRVTGYGMGWYVTRDKAGREVVFHTGAAEGSSSLLAIYPDNSLVMTILLNSERSFVEGAGQIAGWFLQQ